MKKLAIITTHPIQYNAPLFKLLTERQKISVKVFYTWGQSKEGPVYDPTFKMSFNWDIPLLEGYDFEFVNNESRNPGSHHFWGIQNKLLLVKVEEYKPDAVLVFGWSFFSHLKLIRHFKNKTPVLFRGDSTLIDEKAGFSLRKLARRLFLIWVYSHIDKALYTGKANKRYFEAHGVRGKKLIHAPHAVDNDRFRANDEELNRLAMDWRQQLGIPETAIVLLFAGKLEQKKNPLLLLDRFRKIDSHELYLLFAGNGEQEARLRELAGQNPRIKFIGFQNQTQMPLTYRLADIFVLPSGGPGETWGLAINEAMACGLPVLVSDACGGAYDLIEQGVNGIIVKKNNGDELENAIRLLVNKGKQGLKKMGAQSSIYVEDFSFPILAEKIEQAVYS